MTSTYECRNCEAIIKTEKPKNIKCCKNPDLIFLAKEFDKENDYDKFMKILKDPNLFYLITEKELDKKIVGELASRKVIFLSAYGRLVINSQPASFNLLVNDDAGIGKDFVVEKTLMIIPEEQYLHKTRISEKVFSYWHNSEKEPHWTWDGKVFYPEDMSEAVLNSEVFKVMCSSGSSATIVVNQKAVDLEIKGKPVMIVTTASATPNPELTRRYSILNLDSSTNQTEAIMARHSDYKDRGIVPEYDKKIIEAQRLLERVKVRIPFAKLIHQHFPKQNIIMRTLYPRFLDYISASTALYQFQRQRDGDFVLAEGQDYDIARECFEKLCSNKYMIPLTINQKKILSFFEGNSGFRGSALDIHVKGVKDLSDKSIRYHCRILVKYGILDSGSERDTFGNEKEVFFISGSYNPSEKFEIPSFAQISSQRSEPSLASQPSERSEPTKITGGSEGREGSEARIRGKKPLLTDKFNPEEAFK